MSDMPPDPRAALADELREYRKMRYMGDCKCGDCQLVPLTLIDRIIAALRSPSPYSGAAGEAVAWVMRHSDGDLAWHTLNPTQAAAEKSIKRRTALSPSSGNWSAVPLYAHPTTLPRDAERETIERCAHRVELECEENTPAYFASVIRALPSIPPREEPK